VNVKGELIGINTAIASTTGGSVGVGFAVPSNMARAAMQSLLKTGRVVRGFLGANTQDVTPPLSKIFRLPEVKGVIITDIFPKGSAEKAGLRRGDVVLRFDGRDVVDSGKLRNTIALAPIGSRHKLDVVRDHKPLQVELVIQEAPRERTKRAATAEGVALGHPLGGVLVEEVTPLVARQLGLTSATGVVVTAVEEGSLAEAAGISMGDQILEVNRKPVPDLEAYQRLVEPIKPKDLTLLLINRQGTTLYVPIEGE
jgi:serine protease Do